MKPFLTHHDHTSGKHADVDLWPIETECPLSRDACERSKNQTHRIIISEYVQGLDILPAHAISV